MRKVCFASKELKFEYCSHAVVGSPVQRSTYWRACLTGLTDKPLDASREHPLRSTIPTDFVQISADRPIESSGKQRLLGSNPGNYLGSFGFGGPEAFNCPSQISGGPCETASRTASLFLGIPNINPKN
jgi:hypothetical protein